MSHTRSRLEILSRGWYNINNMRTTKNCLNCEQPYLTNYFSERSKYCSKKCLSAHKRKLKRIRVKAVNEEKRKLALQKEYAKRREQRIHDLTVKTEMNKAKHFINMGDGTHQFGDTILTLKNYKEPLKEIPPEEGIGWYGTLAMDVKTGKVQCHLCGDFLESLPGHIFNTHKIKTREYREKFGLAYSTALVSESQRMKLKEKTLQWLASMTEEEKREYIENAKRAGRVNAKKSRGTLGLKKTLEQMNKEGSCPDQTLDEIRKVKEEIGHIPSKGEFIQFKGSQRYVHLAYKHFGSWKKAIEMCGFGENEKRYENGGKTTGQKYKQYTDEELLEYLRIYAQEYGQVPTASDWKRDLLPTHDTYIRHFGSIEEARQRAGVYQIVELSKTMLTRSKHYREVYKNGKAQPPALS